MPDEPDDIETAALLRKLSIVVFSANRPQMLQNLVRYWSRWPVSLIILDGSEIPVPRDSLGEGLGSIHFIAEIDIAQRFLYASDIVQTQYACLHADDDFMLPRAAAQAIAFLESNTDFSCVGSDIQTFKHSDRIGYARTMARFYPWYETGRTIASRTPHERIVEHFSDYRFAYFYGIHRSASFRAAIESIALSAQCPEVTRNPNLETEIELGFELYSAGGGRLGSIPRVFLLKRVGNESPAYCSPADWLTNAENSNSVKAWRNDLSERLALFLHEDPSSMSDWLSEGLALYVQGETEVLGVRRLHQTNRRVGAYAKLLHYFSKPNQWTGTDEESLTLARAADFTRVFAYQSLRRLYRFVMAFIGRPRARRGYVVSSAAWAWPTDISDFERAF